MKYRLLSTTIGIIGLVTIGFGIQKAIAAPNPVVVHFPRMPISGYNFSYTY